MTQALNSFFLDSSAYTEFASSWRKPRFFICWHLANAHWEKCKQQETAFLAKAWHISLAIGEMVPFLGVLIAKVEQFFFSKIQAQNPSLSKIKPDKDSLYKVCKYVSIPFGIFTDKIPFEWGIKQKIQECFNTNKLQDCSIINVQNGLELWIAKEAAQVNNSKDKEGKGAKNSVPGIQEFLSIIRGLEAIPFPMRKLLIPALEDPSIIEDALNCFPAHSREKFKKIASAMQKFPFSKKKTITESIALDKQFYVNFVLKDSSAYKGFSICLVTKEEKLLFSSLEEISPSSFTSTSCEDFHKNKIEKLLQGSKTFSENSLKEKQLVEKRKKEFPHFFATKYCMAYGFYSHLPLEVFKQLSQLHLLCKEHLEKFYSKFCGWNNGLMAFMQEEDKPDLHFEQKNNAFYASFSEMLKVEESREEGEKKSYKIVYHFLGVRAEKSPEWKVFLGTQIDGQQGQIPF